MLLKDGLSSLGYSLRNRGEPCVKVGPVCSFADEGAGGGGATPPASSGGESGKGAAGGETPPGDTPPADGKGKGDQAAEPQYVTPDKLTGVLEAHKRQQAEQIRQQTESIGTLQTTIDQLKEQIAKSAKPEGGGQGKTGGKDPGTADDPEKIELKRRLDQVETQLKDASSRAEKESTLRREETFQRTVIDALVKQKCLKPMDVFRVISPELKQSEDGSRIFATVQTEYGEEDLDVDKYIERVVKEDRLPELFEGQMRSGAPAGGSKGGAGGPFAFTKDQLLNPATYFADIEKSRQAVEQGQVKGMPPRGGN